MVEIEATLFDALRDGAAPTEIFGTVLSGADHSLASARLETLASTARAGVAETFHRSISSDAPGVRGLDDVIRGMWADGWSPEAGDIRLFTAHFGALFSQALLGVAGSVPAFRSTDTLDHFSVWSPTLLLEVFPFHKTHKALVHREGESLFQVYAEFIRHRAA
jgi:hypothetical protein